MSKKLTKKWPGLGPNPFDIDYQTLFEKYKDIGDPSRAGASTPVEKQPAQPPAKGAPPVVENPLNTVNQIESEIEIKNTEFHKSIVKARNESYAFFKTRFMASIHRLMSEYDTLRDEEVAFNKYWISNLQEIQQKHI